VADQKVAVVPRREGCMHEWTSWAEVAHLNQHNWYCNNKKVKAGFSVEVTGLNSAVLVLGSKGPKGAMCTSAGSLVFCWCWCIMGTISS
jgi:hypothetical protein